MILCMAVVIATHYIYGADDFDFNNYYDLDGSYDHILDFSEVDGDTLHIHTLLGGVYHPLLGDDPNDFAVLTEVGGNTLLDVNTFGGGWKPVVRLDGVTGLDIDDMIADGSLIM